MQFLKKLPPLPKLNVTRFLRLGSFSKGPIFVIALLLIILVNTLLLPLPLRIDLSQNQANTLSNPSKEILRKLKKKVTITFYVSDLPTRLLPLKQDIMDLLNEYQKAGGNNVSIVVKDPKNDEKAREQATTAGISEIQFSQMGQDSLNVTKGYFGLTVSYNNDARPIAQLNDFSNIEYTISSLIYSLTQDALQTVSVVGGNSQLGGQGQDNLRVLRELLRQQYLLQELDFFDGQMQSINSEVPPPTYAPEQEKINSAIQAILLFDNGQTTYSDREVAKLREYVKNKGNLLLFIDGLTVNEQTVATQEAKHNLFGLAGEYGIQVNKDLVMSSTAEIVNFGGEAQSLFQPYPYWFKTTVVNRDTGFFSNVNYLTIPWISSLSIQDKNGYTVDEIIKTDPRSWLKTGEMGLSPQEIMSIAPKSFQQYTIGAIARKKDAGSVVVVPSSRFATTQYLSGGASNLNFVVNVVNNFVSGGALSGIRQRTVQSYTLPQWSKQQQDLFKYANMLGLPLLFAAGGIFLLIKRK